MMTIFFKLNIDLVGRAAAQLNWDLNKLHSNISIMKDKIVNGKSLVGVLSAQLKKNDIIKISFDYDDEADMLRYYLSEVGCEVDELQ